MTERSTAQLWIAARRLTSAFHSLAADNFLEIVDEIDGADGWRSVAFALNGDVASLAYEIHGDQTQQWLDQRVLQMLERSENRRDNSD
ncbi:hypothetical protein Mycsm_01260 [Mycobacterium sp. JS623]|uniref:hypothetical protein n=1 Tax=Mycobacterium sp. JS623 TaxID=212767 RepID=UPI0002A56611|nr:hypothetical protein [Mycobacterium sp. JS623]AGB21677.1 hypothetical protein Mycsm_01260 [Mycobacterium sp. JS623]